MNLAPVRALEATITGAARDELPELLGQLARLEALARLRLSENGQAGRKSAGEAAPALDRYLTAAEVAERIGMSTDWVYRHKEELGAVPLGGAVRFPDRSVERYLTGLR